MDDFVISNLHESRNEWCNRLVSIFSPLVVEGIKSIFNEAWKMCLETDEISKYLMTFQNLLSLVPKWNTVIVEEEKKRIIERSGCNYLEDLITCVHIIQLKVLTCIRVGSKQKNIDISIPKLDHFIHKVYIHVARKIYMNVYLFEKNISPLQVQKNGRELELIIQECIMTTIRESIPTEEIIRAYMEESVEHEEEVTIEPIEESVLPPLPKPTLGITSSDTNDALTSRITFNDIDSVLDGLDKTRDVIAPKTDERLDEIATASHLQRKLDNESDDDKLTIGDSIDLGNFDVLDFDELKKDNSTFDIQSLDIEELV